MSDAPLANRGPDLRSGTEIERHDQLNEPWQDSEWQRLWLAIEPKPWRSLAVLPAGEGASLDFTLVIAVTLSRTSMVHVGSPLQVADGTRVSLSQLTAFMNAVKQCVDAGQRLLVALPAVHDSAVTAAIAQAMDAALLCVMSDKMSSAQSKHTIKTVGHARFLGSAIFHPHHFVKPSPT